MAELITENELGRLKHYSSHGGFGIPKYAGEVISVRFESSLTFPEGTEDCEYDHWKLPADVNCNVWMMDSVGEFIDCVLDSDNPALDGCVSVSSDTERYFPRAKIDLNVVQSSGTGIIIVTLNTKTSSIYEVMKNLKIYLDVINPSIYRNKDKFCQIEDEREVWNVFSFSPVEDKSIYDIDEDWNSIAVMMFFIYADRWHMKPLSHMYLANNLIEKIKDSKNLCYALNNIILRDLELPEGCMSIRSLLLGESENSNNKSNSSDKIENRILGLSESEDINLDGPLLVKHSSSITDYKYLLNRLKERKDYLKEFLMKNKEKIVEGKVIIDQDGKVNYYNDKDFKTNKEKISSKESFDEDIESEFCQQPTTLESTNKDIQVIKQDISELQLQLVGIMDMFMATTPASFTVQGTANEITYKSLLEEIQYMESTLILHNQSLQARKSEVSNQFVVTDNDQISALQPVISNSGYTQFIDRMEKLRNSVELYGIKSREAVIDNKNLLNESREYAFNKIRSIEIRFDQLNREFNNFLFSISYSSFPSYINSLN
ncbi:uncharacterized protein cubi_03206 [Cryptosporidium ubiquitum]|uniref:Uncharacterized protein n=1 Tax=Cryptosporidium ubiquitum TaxID=857276 RepID=A0A1J4MLY2_9CRYT|nr:uncharacterized protein cubi_03206 [Cryptosporidium ubiquitum]OII75190.1 hypothetical protein cubi_03206 [Cryptosporidium ubiquitum]